MLNRDMNLLVIRRFSSSTLQRTKQELNKEQEGTDQLSFLICMSVTTLLFVKVTGLAREMISSF